MIKQWLQDFIHNAVIHPLLMVLPRRIGDHLHEKNAAWAFGKRGPEGHANDAQVQQCPHCKMGLS